MTDFVHLRLHTEYSLRDGLIRIKPLIDAVKKAGMPACAVTDFSNLFGMVKFYRAAQAGGIKPLIGTDLLLHQENEPATPLLLLCQDQTGYLNLNKLISRCYLEGQQQGIPYLRKNWLRGMTTGLIALSGGVQGDIGQALIQNQLELAKKRLNTWKELFPQSFYLEIQRINQRDEEEYIQRVIDLALAEEVPVVATNAVCFLKEQDFEAHEVRVCIHAGYTLMDDRRPRLYTMQQYLRSPQEMTELFADIPEAIENSVLIAKRCNLELTLGKNFLPDFPIPTGTSLADYFTQQACHGLTERLKQLFDITAPDFAKTQAIYEERLEREIKTIIQMGFAGYFLIVADFIQWSKNNNIPVGPGRGSGAGSLVAYVLGITDLDPLPYDLLFERFLNPERVSMPDFDIDFCMEGRDAVINYVAEHYGRDRVSQIITYGTMAAKAVVRDVGRVLGHPYGFVDKIAKLIPFELGMTLDKALQEEALQQRYEAEEEVRTLIDMARKLEGLTRNAGKHAGGVVIAPSVLTDFAPLYCEAEDSGSVVTQFDKGDVEEVGLVKFDFLGLRTLTIIKWALETIAHFQGKPLDILRIPLDDKKSYELLKKGNTTAVFQLESRGMKELIKRLKPDCFEEIIALVALFRPGPLQSGMVDDFIARKHGEAPIEYLHSSLSERAEIVNILKPTYGVIVYQEQVMQIAQAMANYTLGGADLLRRAMGKKKPEEMAKQRSFFIEGSEKNNIPPDISGYIFDLIEKFAGYGFNKSHSAAYALISYQTAWLKTHYPAAFMAAVLSSDMDKLEKVVPLVEECRAMGLKIILPDINISHYKFTIRDEKTILYGLGAIKGVGEAAILSIVAEREKKGNFVHLFEFCRRLDTKKVNRRTLEGLIKSGALDVFQQPRAVLMASLDSALRVAEKYLSAQTVGQNDIFGMLALAPLEKVEKREETPYVAAKWSQTDILAAENEVLGMYLSGHPIRAYQAELTQLCKTTLLSVRPTNGRAQTVKVGGWVTQVRHHNSKFGRMAALTLEDSSGRLEAVVYAELYQSKRELLVEDNILILQGLLREDENRGYSLRANEVMTLEEARSESAKRIVLTVTQKQGNADLAKSLLDILKKYRKEGKCSVVIQYQPVNTAVEVVLGAGWQVKADKDLLQHLKGLVGEENMRIIY